MIVEIYDACFDNEKYSDNGINIVLRRCIPANEIAIEFLDDNDKELFSVVMKLKEFIEMVNRIKNDETS